VSDLPDGSKWEYELKLDGYRAIAVKRCGRILLFSRNGRDFTQRFRPLATFTEAPPVGGLVPPAVRQPGGVEMWKSLCPILCPVSIWNRMPW
jgi:bifunctional non-homologous end joining protein LigD